MKVLILATALLISNQTFAFGLFSNEMNADEKAMYEALQEQANAKEWTQEEKDKFAKDAEEKWFQVNLHGTGDMKCAQLTTVIETHKLANPVLQKKVKTYSLLRKNMCGF